MGARIHRVGNLGYEHITRTIKRSNVPARELLPRVHRAASLLKRWFLGTLQGGVRAVILTIIWMNSRLASIVVGRASRGLLFYGLMQQAARTDSISYKRLLGGMMACNLLNPVEA